MLCAKKNTLETYCNAAFKQYFENGDLKKQFFVKTMHRKEKVQKPSLQKQNVQILLGRNNTSEQCLKGETIEKFYFRQFYY